MEKYKVTNEDRKNMPALTDAEIIGMVEYGIEYSKGKFGCMYCGYSFTEQEYREAGDCCPMCPEDEICGA